MRAEETPTADHRPSPPEECPPVQEPAGKKTGKTGEKGTTGTTGRGADLAAAGAGVLLVVVAVLVGRAIERADGALHVNWPPLFASWDPHIGPGTPAAVLVALAVVVQGPAVAARLSWRALTLATWATSMAWVFSLALVDGWHDGIAQRLTTREEYLQGIGRFGDIGAAVRGYTSHILLYSPGHWPAHLAGHPPGAVLTFVGLDRLGLGGGGWAGVWCVVTGASAAVAVLVTVRALAGEALARRAAPFLVVAPTAVWIGASADGYFAAVAAWAVALFTLAATRTVRSPATAAVASGLLFGALCYLSYGLALIAVIGVAVLLISRSARPLPLFLAGALVAPAVFTLAGFNWWEAYQLLVERYYQGVARIRPYGYWVWANLACTVLMTGLATVAGMRRACTAKILRGVRTGTLQDTGRLALLVLAALLALLLADLSGMSKAETERIWLPFACWLLPAAALLPDRGRRGWLTAQTVLALLINHLLFTGW
ncbi:hypothetical protein [Streptomyces sp. NBC_00370]|uniref:hypothetical protein n=1 Tax=Streptomyces sp. NBC_00370 TaxID=2975728 RepID=UPI002E25E8E5